MILALLPIHTLKEVHMKGLFLKGICLAIASALLTAGILLGFASAKVSADDTVYQPYQTIQYNFRSRQGSSVTEENRPFAGSFSYSDEMWFCNIDKDKPAFSADIAKMSMALAVSAYYDFGLPSTNDEVLDDGTENPRTARIRNGQLR